MTGLCTDFSPMIITIQCRDAEARDMVSKMSGGGGGGGGAQAYGYGAVPAYTATSSATPAYAAASAPPAPATPVYAAAVVVAPAASSGISPEIQQLVRPFFSLCIFRLYDDRILYLL